MPSIVPSSDEQWVLDLWQWLGRALQYAVDHPAAAAFASRAHDRLSRALDHEGTLALGIFKDGLTVGTTHASNPALRTKMGPYFHERGAVMVRFAAGVTLEELTSFVRIATLPVSEVFAAGGMRALTVQRGIVRIEVEEIAHDILSEGRDEDRRVTRLRELFLSLLGSLRSHAATPLGGIELLELLDEPKVLARILEATDPPKAIGEIVAGLADQHNQAEEHHAVDLQPKMRALLSELAPEARDRLLIGFASLDPAARAPLGRVLGGFEPRRVAELVLPSVRMHAYHIDRLYFAMRAIVPDAGVRIEVLRRLARLLHDLPLDEPVTFDVMAALARPPTDDDPYRFERAVLSKIAARIHEDRAAFRVRPGAHRRSAEPFEPAPLDALDHRAARDVALHGAKIVDFGDFAARLPALSDSLARAGRAAASAGLIGALVAIDDPRWKPATGAALRAIAQSPATLHVVRDLDHHEERWSEVGPMLRVVAVARPDVLFTVLENAQNRKFRRAILEALSACGPAIAHFVRQRLAAPEWYVVRNMLALAPRVALLVSDVAPMLKHPQPKVRVEAARALRGMAADPRACELLASLLDDAEGEVQLAAIAGLAELPLSPNTVTRMEHAVLDERRPDDVRFRAVDALGRSTMNEAVEALFRLLEPRGLLERPFVAALRERAAAALHHSRAPVAPALFAQARQSGAWRVRKACEKALDGEPDV
jgi:hypothetical protein